MGQIEKVDIDEWAEMRHKSENNGMKFEDIVSTKWEEDWKKEVLRSKKEYLAELKRKVSIRRDILLGTYSKDEEYTLHFPLEKDNYRFSRTQYNAANEMCKDSEDLEEILQEVKYREIDKWNAKNDYDKRKNDLISKIQHLKKRLMTGKFTTMDEKEKLIQRIDKLGWQLENLDLKKEKLEECKWDYPYGKRSYFDILTNVERDLYDMLLDSLVRSDENQVNTLEKAKKGEWEYIKIEVREEIIKLLTCISELGIWNINEQRLQEIRVKVLFPLEYRLKLRIDNILYNYRELVDNRERIYQRLLKVDKELESIEKEICNINSDLYESEFRNNILKHILEEEN